MGHVLSLDRAIVFLGIGALIMIPDGLRRIPEFSGSDLHTDSIER
jgi:hypothetical protein